MDELGKKRLTYECWKRWRQRAQRKSFSGKPTSPHMEQTVAVAAVPDSRGLEEARDGRSERERRRQERGVVRMWLNLNEKGRSGKAGGRGGGRGVQWC